MSKIHQTGMKKEECEENSSPRNIVKLSYYLLIVCGLTFSTDGITISRRMVVYSGAIYVINLILIFKDATCFDKEDDFEFTESLCLFTYRIALLILVSLTMHGTVKMFPSFIKKLEKLEKSVGDDSLQKEIQSSVKRISTVGLVCSIILATGLTLFLYFIGTDTLLENCPNHRWFFGIKKQHEYVFRVVTVGNIFPGFQCIAGLTFLMNLCQVVTLYFTYLRKQLTKKAASDMDIESMENTSQELRYNTKQIYRIRILYEQTCDLTAKLDEGINVAVGIQLVVLVPLICLFSYNAFVLEFHWDHLFYALFAFFHCLLILVATANLNSQVTSYSNKAERILLGTHMELLVSTLNRCDKDFLTFQAHAMADVLYKIDASSTEDAVRNQVCIRKFYKVMNLLVVPKRIYSGLSRKANLTNLSDLTDIKCNC